MNSKKSLSIKPLVILILTLLTIVVEAFPEDSISKIDPMDHLRGRRLSESTRQLVRMCNSMAEMGLSYEAARLLKSASVYSKNKETSEEAKHILISWRINEMEINDANADSIRKKIRKTLNRNRSALLDHKRVQTLLTVGRITQAAKVIANAKQVELFGESKESQRRILNELNIKQETLDKAIDQKSLKSILKRSMEISRLNEISEFLRIAHPESGNAMRTLIRKVYPETAKIDSERNRERDQYRSSFSRRLPENARPPAMRVQDDGEHRRGREGSFSFFTNRTRPQSNNQQDEPLSIKKIIEIAGDLSTYDNVLSAYFLTLAEQSITDEINQQKLSENIQILNDSKTINSSESLRPSGAFLKPLKKQDKASQLFSSNEVFEYKITLSDKSIESLKKEPKLFTKATFEHKNIKLENVGIRLKGFLGSFRPFDGQNKNGFTVKFNAFKKGQRFKGLNKIQLNNAAQDSTYLRERLGYSLFREAGLPAPRVGHAAVLINGEPFGLYVQVEASTEDFLNRWFEDSSGDLYEGPTDITNWKNLDLDSDPKKAERGLLIGFADAANKAKEMNNLTYLKDWIDLGHFARFMAMEILCDHWDGYLSPNNYRLYRNPSDRKFYFIPHGADQLFRNSSNNLFGSSRGRSVIVEAFRSTDEGELMIEEALNYLLSKVWNPEKMAAQIMQDYHRLRPYILADPKRSFDLFEVEERLQSTIKYFAKTDRLKRWQLMALDDQELQDRLSRFNGRSRWGR
jgi:spore coat protein CotH